MPHSDRSVPAHERQRIQTGKCEPEKATIPGTDRFVDFRSRAYSTSGNAPENSPRVEHDARYGSPQSHISAPKRKRIGSSTLSVSDRESASSIGNDLPGLAADISTASEDDSSDAAGSIANEPPGLNANISTASETESRETASSSNEAIETTAALAAADNASNERLTATAQPESEFARQLRLNNRMLEEQDDEQDEPMHKWLDDSNDPWSVPKMLYGQGRVERVLALATMMAEADRLFPPRH